MAAVVDGDAQAGRADSARSLSDANFFYSQANQTAAADQQLFVSYATAAQAEDAELADYLQTLMRPEMAEALQWWSSTDDAATPSDEVEGNPYTLSDLEAAQEPEPQSPNPQPDAADAPPKGSKH